MQLLTIIATLDSGESTEYKGNVRAEAMGLSVLITKYSSVFLMLFVQKLSSCHQTTCNAFAKQLIDVGRNKFVEMRSDEAFEILNVDVKSFINENCSKLDVKTEFKEKRIAKKKSMAGELSRDKMADDPTTRFKSETYFTIMDTL